MKKIFFVSCLYANMVFSQDKSLLKLTPEIAAAKIKSGNYEAALSDYLKLLSTDIKNVSYNYNVGVCYLNTNFNKAKAIPYLEIAARSQAIDKNVKYLLGRAYQFANRFDDAINVFVKFKEEGKGSISNLTDVDLQVQHCLNAKELLKYPVDVDFQNIGDNINSDFDDYNLSINAEENLIIYNSKRFENGGDNIDNKKFRNIIYKSKAIDGIFLKSTILDFPGVTDTIDFEAIGLSATGEKLVLHKPGVNGGIYISKVEKGNVFSKPEKLDFRVNSQGDEIAASISSDGNTLFFSSNRKGGFGGKDIYYTKKTIDGKWSVPVNAGSSINTIYDEDYPNLSPDNGTLYFSSKGHSSIGGYDIFRSSISDADKKFSTPKNIGFPINTSDDDINFKISKNGKSGYIASSRNTSRPNLDIFKIIFNEVESDYSVVIGELYTKDNIPVNYSESFISIRDNVTNELINNYVPNPSSGRFVIILPPGKYQLNIETKGFQNITKVIEVFDKSSYQSEITLALKLVKE